VLSFVKLASYKVSIEASREVASRGSLQMEIAPDLYAYPLQLFPLRLTNVSLHIDQLINFNLSNLATKQHGTVYEKLS